MASDEVECAMLTGGMSRRMGADKASVPIHGIRADEYLVRLVTGAGYGVTVLGRSPVEGAAFLPDEEDYRGAAAALARFFPAKPLVFVLACDVYRFDPAFIRVAHGLLTGAELAANRYEVVVPCVEGHRQPLCALYVSSALEGLRQFVARGEYRLRRWLDSLRAYELTDQQIAAAGLDPRCVRNANTPDELEALLAPDRRHA